MKIRLISALLAAGALGVSGCSNKEALSVPTQGEASGDKCQADGSSKSKTKEDEGDEDGEKSSRSGSTSKSDKVSKDANSSKGSGDGNKVGRHESSSVPADLALAGDDDFALAGDDDDDDDGDGDKAKSDEGSSSTSSSSSKKTTTAPQVSYESKIKALLKKHCISCHSADADQPASPELTSWKDVKAASSDIARAVATGDMPMGKSLAKVDKDAFATWKKNKYAQKATGASSGDESEDATAKSTSKSAKSSSAGCE